MEEAFHCCKKDCFMCRDSAPFFNLEVCCRVPIHPLCVCHLQKPSHKPSSPEIGRAGEARMCYMTCPVLYPKSAEMPLEEAVPTKPIMEPRFHTQFRPRFE